MRQLIVLVVGLMLIAVWGVGLRLAIHGSSLQNEPEAIPADSHARPLISATASSTPEFIHQSRVVPANFQSALSIREPQLVSVLDKIEGRGVLWNAKLLQKSAVWLRSDRIQLTYSFFPRPAGHSETVAIKVDATKVGQSNAINSVMAWTQDLLVFELDLATVPSSEFQVVLKGVRAQDADPYSFECALEPVGGRSARIRKSRLAAPYAPVVQETRMGANYPWQAVPSELQIQRKLYKELQSTVGAHLTAYEKTNEVIGIGIGFPSNTNLPLEVMSAESVPFNSSTKVVTVDNRVETGLPPYAKLEFIYAAANNTPGDSNHTFGKQIVVVDLIDRVTAKVTTRIQQVADRDPIDGQFYATNQQGKPSVTVQCESATPLQDRTVACQLFRSNEPISEPALVTGSTVKIESANLFEGLNLVEARLFAGDAPLTTSSSVASMIDVKTGGFRVEEAGPDAFGTVIGQTRIELLFSRPIKTSIVSAVNASNSRVRLLYSPNGKFGVGTGNTLLLPEVKFDASSNASLLVQPTPVQQGYYQIIIVGGDLQDDYGNYFENPEGVVKGNFVKTFGGAAQLAAEAYPVTPGVNRGNANMVEYPEFVQPRKVPTGFNPNDKVETRVARLYFYRDAHRVAQILNRRVQSYNRQEVAVRRQLADKSRQEADSRTTNRQMAERAAVQAAQRTRELENQLSDTQRSLNSTLQQLQSAAGQPVTQENQARQQQIIDQLQTTARSFAQQAGTLESQVRSARDAEVAANERWQQNQREEDLARTDQFRMETAAAHADPDTFAEGKPDSQDPVAQVSISVIGEGLLHLRGPLKGVNQVRMMVDQIDSPQGQVRINVHSTQINGDEADELEVVANRIQTYIDQARFLTVQSAEMLRKAVIHVAATRAEEARGLYPGASQAERDQLYLHAFFGVDFVNELRSMDSELLHTGNKLLSLHSMEVTSLSSALMMLALANNGTRLAILEEFQRLVQSDLATSEQQYIQNGIGACVGGCKKGCKHHQQGPPIYQLAGNSTFTSLKGFFDSQLQNNDTMSPLQREAIGLAQILKARLVTEMEYKQRVMERAVIEERTQSAENSEAQLLRERHAEEEVRKARTAQVTARSTVLPRVARSTAIIDESEKLLHSANNAMSQLTIFVEQENPKAVSISPNVYQQVLGSVAGRIERTTSDRARNVLNQVQKEVQKTPDLKREEPIALRDDTWLELPEGTTGFKRSLYFPLNAALKHKADPNFDFDSITWVFVTEDELNPVRETLLAVRNSLNGLRSTVTTFHGDKSDPVTQLDRLTALIESSQTNLGLVPQLLGGKYPIATVAETKQAIRLSLLLIEHSAAFTQKSSGIVLARDEFLAGFAKFSTSQATSGIEHATVLYRLWNKFTTALDSIYDHSPATQSRKIDTDRWIAEANASLETWLDAVSKLDAAQSIAQDARRPLDHKKFLDMLIDELEEKYIELLEGTRAHTANIDNYLKRLTTSLDDDFNTQYYYPVFRLVREASQYKRVEFGQTETTNILVNNREFGKVSPSATMEFDLPKRDILIQEGLDSALAIYNDVGALVNDPNLLALAKMQSGSSVASPGAGTTGGMGTIRNVLPGLQSDSAEQLMAQNAGSGPKFESNVEKLIPDPAVYKFETGTGYEIRPVIAPDGQAVVFDFHYLYSTQIREPVRADEKHLGRVKQHFIDTDVQLSNFELREVSRYVVALKAERTANGVPLLEDIPVIGALWRPLPNREKSLQQNIIMAQATIFPTLFDLMGLRWAPAISDLDPLQLSNREYLVRGRNQYLENRIYDYSSARVDEFLRIPEDLRRPDLYRSQETIPTVHPNGYRGPGLDYQNSQMREGYNPEESHVAPGYVPAQSPEGSMYLPNQQHNPYYEMPRGARTMEAPRKMELAPPSRNPSVSGMKTTPNRIPAPPELKSSTSSRVSDGWQYQRAN